MSGRNFYKSSLFTAVVPSFCGVGNAKVGVRVPWLYIVWLEGLAVIDNGFKLPFMLVFFFMEKLVFLWGCVGFEGWLTGRHV